jgi:hypothetical protein
LGFDTLGDEAGILTSLPKDFGKNPWKAPVVSDADRNRIPQIIALEKQREISRGKRADLNVKLKELSNISGSERPNDWTVKVARTKEKISGTEKLEQFYNYAIGELLRKTKKQPETTGKTNK